MGTQPQCIVRLGGALTVVIFGCLTACAQVETTMTEYATDTPHSPRQIESVDVMRAEPKDSYERLGEIVVKATVKPAPSETQIESELRAAAATMGADAVVIIEDRTRQPLPSTSQRWWASDPQAENNREVVGIAIKFR